MVPSEEPRLSTTWRDCLESWLLAVAGGGGGGGAGAGLAAASWISFRTAVASAAAAAEVSVAVGLMWLSAAAGGFRPEGVTGAGCSKKIGATAVIIFFFRPTASAL
jgi:hypothetical protein